MGKAGFGLIQLVLAAGLGFTTLAFISKGLISNMKLERGIATNSELESFSDTLRLYFSRTETCAKIGLVGTKVDLNNPRSLPVKLQIPGVNQAYVVGSLIHSTRKISQLYFEHFEPIGNGSYIATLALETSVARGTATTFRNPGKKFYLALTLDSAQRILSCSSTTNEERSCNWYSADAYTKKSLINELTTFDAYPGQLPPSDLKDASYKASGWACDWDRVRDHCGCPQGYVMTGYDLFICPGWKSDVFRARCYCCNH